MLTKILLSIIAAAVGSMPSTFCNQIKTADFNNSKPQSAEASIYDYDRLSCQQINYNIVGNYNDTLNIISNCGNIGIDNSTPTNAFAPKPIIVHKADNMADVVTPAIVGITANDAYKQSVGAGVCVAEGGIIVTNSHVVHDYNNIEIYLADGTSGNATILFEDTILDFAILACNLNLPYLPISQNNVVVGDEVIAVGTPISLNLKHTFTKGIVSAIDRTIAISTKDGNSYMHNLIQHDASLNRGNSGGPLLNTNGEVVGINTLKLKSSEGIGFAIPARVVTNLLAKVISNESSSIPYLGILGYDVEIAYFNQICTAKQGFYIEHIDPNSILCNLLQAGDVITAINDKAITNAIDLRTTIYGLLPKTTITITYIRNNNYYNISISLPAKK